MSAVVPGNSADATSAQTTPIRSPLRAVVQVLLLLFARLMDGSLLGSLGLHLVALGTLTLIFVPTSKPPAEADLQSQLAEVEEVPEMEIVQTEPIELAPLSEMLEISEPPPPSAPLEVAGMSPTLGAQPQPAVTMPSPNALARLFEDSVMGGLGTQAFRGTKGMGTSFFGVKSSGNRFIFVVDNSKSMNRNDRFKSALDEMNRSVSKLNKRQFFYVIFFSDIAYPLFHPQPAERMVLATDDNKARLAKWLYEVELYLKTKPKEALALALKLRPDAIYLLTDGQFNDGTEAMLREQNSTKIRLKSIPIHTIAFDSREGEVKLKRIAEAHGGTFRFVPGNGGGKRKNPANNRKTKP